MRAKLWHFVLGLIWAMVADAFKSSVINPFPMKQKHTRMTPDGIPRATPKTKTIRVLSAVTAAESGEERAKLLSFPLTIWRFTRPHTLIGSALAIPAIHAMAAPSYTAAASVSSLVSIIYTTTAALFMNLYITGLNQITDVEIDKINKPNLPIPTGDLSIKKATYVVLVALAASLWMGTMHAKFATQGLNVALWGSGILGTLYSLPPFRLKRFPLLAAFCIVAVRGSIINAGFYAHAKHAVFGEQAGSVLYYLLKDPVCTLSSLFFGIFGIVIALMKDVPDVAGDEQAKVRTFSVRIGQKRIFKSMKRLLSVLFLLFGIGFIRGGLDTTVRTTAVIRMIIGTFALVAGISVKMKANNVNPEDSKEVYQYYMYLWKLFYGSYLMLPFAR
mmetsp:Transcript_11568/g.17788  ORF Transcript_11568/g.17788 Transcript_11568/m.17788 type:complete len:388 (-) Transcript_11568:3486-4649(-)